jgi:predicted regulator of Ras-like GTPase activity (Roadblock/LC7/MglB family)
MNKQEALLSVLGNLRASIPEITGVLVASKGGTNMAELITCPHDSEQIAERVAVTVALSQQIAELFKTGEMTQTTIFGVEESIHFYSTEQKGVVVAPHEINNVAFQTQVRLATQAAARVLA